MTRLRVANYEQTYGVQTIGTYDETAQTLLRRREVLHDLQYHVLGQIPD